MYQICYIWKESNQILIGIFLFQTTSWIPYFWVCPQTCNYESWHYKDWFSFWTKFCTKSCTAIVVWNYITFSWDYDWGRTPMVLIYYTCQLYSNTKDQVASQEVHGLSYCSAGEGKLPCIFVLFFQVLY